MKTARILLFFYGMALACGVAQAADQSEAETRLREALKNTVLQLRTAETDRANLQAAQAALLDEKKALSDQLEALKKHSADERAAADKTIAGLNAKVSDQAAQIAQLKDVLEKYKSAYEQTSEMAKWQMAQRLKQGDEAIVLQRRLADCQSKNVELFKLGNEILTRYENFGLGNALSAKEPFIGATRTKLENLVQDYEDRLLAQRAKP